MGRTEGVSRDEIEFSDEQLGSLAARVEARLPALRGVRGTELVRETLRALTASGFAVSPLPRVGDELEELVGTSVHSAPPGDRYRLDAVLGGGALGVVFRARGDSLSQSAVVKVTRPGVEANLSQAARAAWFKESVAMARLNVAKDACPYVVRFLDRGELQVAWRERSLKLPWLAMEYVDGGQLGTTLQERVERSQHAFDPARAARAIRCLGEGLEAVHSQGVVHRDVKPDNVLCSGTGDSEIFKIADFGVARVQGVQTFKVNGVGTFGYGAPEQLQNIGVNPKADVFSMACVVFFLLTGSAYFGDPNLDMAMTLPFGKWRPAVRAQSRTSPKLEANRARAIDRILKQATLGDVSKREPASCAELARSLLAVLES